MDQAGGESADRREEANGQRPSERPAAARGQICQTINNARVIDASEAS